MLPLLPLPDVDDQGVLGGFSGRLGGVSAGPFAEANVSLRVGDEPSRVLANRRRMLAGAGLGRRPLLTVRQEHGGRVVQVSRAGGGGTSADGMVTRDPGIALMIGAADCVPVMLYDGESGVVGALHVGWRGLLRDIVAAGVAALCAAGGRAAAARAVLGPAIDACCYPVGGDVHAAVTAAHPVAAARSRAGAPALDLPRATAQALADAGIVDVRRIGGCTADDPIHFFSARRDGRTGCQAGVVALAGH